MPDFLAGQTLTPLHFPPTVSDTETGSFDTTLSANYGVTTSAGTYADCGAAFIAPTTGRVRIEWAASLDNGTASAATLVSPHVRTGGTVGSGSDVAGYTADDARCIFNRGTDARRFGAALLVTGLTPGDTYNVRLEHKVTAGPTTGTIVNRHVIVSPAT